MSSSVKYGFHRPPSWPFRRRSRRVYPGSGREGRLWLPARPFLGSERGRERILGGYWGAVGGDWRPDGGERRRGRWSPCVAETNRARPGDYTPLARVSFGEEAPRPRLPPCVAVALVWRHGGRRRRGEGLRTVVWHQRPVTDQRLSQVVWPLRVPESTAVPFHPYAQLLVVPTYSENSLYVGGCAGESLGRIWSPVPVLC